MRHHDGYTATFVGDRGNAVRRAVRVCRVVLCHLAIVIDKAQRHQPFAFKRRKMRSVAQFYLPFTMRNRNRHL
ncbi:hypothetical protein D3C71_2031290 [compost metagenome]